MITIVTANWNAYDFLDLMIESLAFYSRLPYELIVIDNSSEKRTVQRSRVHQFFMHNNIGHGRGLNHGVKKAYELFPNNPFLMFLDVDCHVLCHNWEVPFIGSMKQYDLIGGKGVVAKPIRPACMFMKREMGAYDWCDTKAYGGHRKTPEGYDVAILAYYRMQADGRNIGFLERAKNGVSMAGRWFITTGTAVTLKKEVRTFPILIYSPTKPSFSQVFHGDSPSSLLSCFSFTLTYFAGFLKLHS